MALRNNLILTFLFLSYLQVTLQLVCNVDQVKIYGYRNGSVNDYLETSLDDITAHLGDTLDLEKPTVVYTFGYEGQPNGTYTSEVMTAYTKRTNEWNIFLLGWQSSNSLGLPIADYAVIIPCMNEVADRFTIALRKLFSAGLKPEMLHLIGHSLGAHLFGHCGRTVKNDGTVVGRITGCDPAYPGYGGLIRIDTPLRKGDATFVDNIHVDPGFFGMVKPTGDIDIYVNYGLYQNGTRRQPGCPVPTTYKELFCSHYLAPQLMAASLTESNNLLASKADDYDAWVAADGAENSVIEIGQYVNQQMSGVFYMSANGQPPYGRGLAGLQP